jgi:hypothetical protein
MPLRPWHVHILTQLGGYAGLDDSDTGHGSKPGRGEEVQALTKPVTESGQRDREIFQEEAAMKKIELIGTAQVSFKKIITLSDSEAEEFIAEGSESWEGQIFEEDLTDIASIVGITARVR